MLFLTLENKSGATAWTDEIMLKVFIANKVHYEAELFPRRIQIAQSTCGWPWWGKS